MGGGGGGGGARGGGGGGESLCIATCDVERTNIIMTQ